MKFVSLDNSGEMEPLEVLFPLSSTPGKSLLPEMQVIGLDSESPLPDLDSVPLQQGATAPLASDHAMDATSESTGTLRVGDFWLEGESIMCACPDCSALISIRHWLMIADCW